MTKKDKLQEEISAIKDGLKSDLEESFKNSLRDLLKQKEKELADLKDESPKPAPAKKPETGQPAKKSPKDVLANCREILAKHNKEKKNAKQRVEKRKKQGKPAQLTPAEVVSKTAKSVKAKVVDMKDREKTLPASEVDKLTSGIIATIKSTLEGIKDTTKKHDFLFELKKEIGYLYTHLSKVAMDGGMFKDGGSLDNFNPKSLIGNYFYSRINSGKITDVNVISDDNVKVKFQTSSGTLSIEKSFTKKELFDMNNGKSIDGNEIIKTTDGGMFADGGGVGGRDGDLQVGDVFKNTKDGEILTIVGVPFDVRQYYVKEGNGDRTFVYDSRDFWSSVKNGDYVKISSSKNKMADGGALDGLMGDINAPVQNVGGTLFSTADLTSHLDITNPMFKDGGQTNFTKKWKVVGIDLYGKHFEKVITLGRMSNENDVMMQLRRMNLPIREVTMIKEYEEGGLADYYEKKKV